MTFIIICIALIVERFFHWAQLRHWRWFLQYEQWLSRYLSHRSAFLSLCILIVPPVFIIGLIDYLISGWLYGVVKLIYGVVILLYCLGPSNLWDQVYRSLNDLMKDDHQVGFEQVQASFGVNGDEGLQSFHQAFVTAIFTAALERIFAVLFWFAVLGPMGALLYRLVSFCSQQSALNTSKTATQLKLVLDWIPVRIFTFLFALCGHFKNVFAQWKNFVLKGMTDTVSLLKSCGIAALDVMENGRLPEDGTAEKESLELLDRVFVMALVILAVIVLLV